MLKKIKFTKAALNRLPNAAPGTRDEYSDTDSSLCLRVTSTGVKSFYVRSKLKKKAVRVTLGRHPDLPLVDAIAQAKEVTGALAKGVNPNVEKRAKEAAEVTLQQVLNEYLRTRKSLKPTTVEDYKRAIRETCSDWLDKPMVRITKEKVRRRHEMRGKESKARTNNAMRVLRALFNFAQEIYEDGEGNSLFPVNPVVTLSRTKSWHEVKRKKTYISEKALPAWYHEVMALDDIEGTHNTIAKMYFLFLLFTGCRATEARTLKRENVDLENGEFTLTDTKNRNDITLPLSDHLTALLRPYLKDKAVYVFPGQKGHINSPRRQIKEVGEATTRFSAHDLRRTFLTIAEAEDMGGLTIKRLVNHKAAESDVTAGYIVKDMDRLRRATNKISNRILRIVDQGKPAEVVSIKDRAG